MCIILAKQHTEDPGQNDTKCKLNVITAQK